MFLRVSSHLPTLRSAPRVPGSSHAVLDRIMGLGAVDVFESWRGMRRGNIYQSPSLPWSISISAVFFFFWPKSTPWQSLAGNPSGVSMQIVPCLRKVSLIILGFELAPGLHPFQPTPAPCFIERSTYSPFKPPPLFWWIGHSMQPGVSTSLIFSKLFPSILGPNTY